MSLMMNLESVSLSDLPKDVNVKIFPTEFLSKINVEIQNNRTYPINLNVLGTVLTPSHPKYYSFIVCSILNEKLPESIIIYPQKTIKETLQVVLAEGFDYFPNKFIKYKIANSKVHPQVLRIIQRFLQARRKRYRCETQDVNWKFGERVYFRLDHVKESVQKLRKRLGSSFITNEQESEN